jgi:membrane fusion protein, multidrug efflux system
LSRISALCSVILGFCLAASGALADSEAPSVQIKTVSLRQQELRDTLTAYGTVASTEEAMNDVSFPHAGQITALDVRAGQKVHADDPLVTITADPATLQNYEKTRAALDFAKSELERVQSLRAQHLATNAQVASAQMAVIDASVALDTERKLGNDQPTKTATAAFDGYVAQLMAAPGARLQANSTIMKLARTDQGLRIAAGLKPEDAGRVIPGMPAEVTPIMAAGSQPVEGKVRQISGTINPTTKLVDAWIDVMETGTLVPGTSASVVIILSRHVGWVVPRNAVLHDDKGSYIFQVADGRAKRIEVTPGMETDQLTEISGGFDPALKVVESGNYELRNGMAVREASSANP